MTSYRILPCVLDGNGTITPLQEEIELAGSTPSYSFVPETNYVITHIKRWPIALYEADDLGNARFIERAPVVWNASSTPGDAEAVALLLTRSAVVYQCGAGQWAAGELVASAATVYQPVDGVPGDTGALAPLVAHAATVYQAAGS